MSAQSLRSPFLFPAASFQQIEKGLEHQDIMPDVPQPEELASYTDFIFDNQMLLQIIYYNFSIGEVTCPTRYMKDASSIGGMRVIKYGLGVLQESVMYRLNKMGAIKHHLYQK